MRMKKNDNTSELIIQDDRTVRIIFLIVTIIVFFYTLFLLLLCSIDYNQGGILVCLIVLFSLELPLLVVAILLMGSGRFRISDNSIQSLFFKKIVYEVKKESIYAIVYGHSYSVKGRFSRPPVPTLYIVSHHSNKEDLFNELFSFDLNTLQPYSQFYMLLEGNKNVMTIKNVRKSNLDYLSKHGYKYINCFVRSDIKN